MIQTTRKSIKGIIKSCQDLLNNEELDSTEYLRNTEKFSKICANHFKKKIDTIKEVLDSNWKLPSSLINGVEAHVEENENVKELENFLN